MLPQPGPAQLMSEICQIQTLFGLKLGAFGASEDIHIIRQKISLFAKKLDQNRTKKQSGNGGTEKI